MRTYLGPGAQLHNEGHLVQMRKPLQEHHRRLKCLPCHVCAQGRTVMLSMLSHL